VPQEFAGRRVHAHNANVTLVRTTPHDNLRIGSWIAQRLNRMQGPVRFLLPMGGVSALDAPGQPYWWPEADAALFNTIERETRCDDRRRVVRVDAHINDARFIAAAVAAVREVTAA
jgi:uncharacterized protein (UPF0261 family)